LLRSLLPPLPNWRSTNDLQAIVSLIASAAARDECPSMSRAWQFLDEAVRACSLTPICQIGVCGLGEPQLLEHEHKNNGRLALIVVAVAFLFVGGIFLFIGGGFLVEEWRYRRQAVRSDAVTTGKALRHATDTSDTAYELSYRMVLEGRPYQRTEPVAVHVWEREPNSVIQVEYLNGRPQSVRVMADTGGETARSIIAVAIGGLLILVGLTAAMRAVRRGRSPHTANRSPSPSFDHSPASSDPSYSPLARRSSEFWTGAIFVVVGAPLLVAAVMQIHEEWRFSHSAVSTDGIVLTKEIKRSGRGNRTKSYEATYRFMVPEGTFENRARLSSTDWARLKERQPVEVLYLPGTPSKGRVAGPRPWTWTTFISVLGCVFFVIGATFLLRSIRQARLEWRLRRHGVAAEGTITELRDRRLKTNGVRQWRLHYEYDDFQGRRHAATHDLSEGGALPWTIGDIGIVRYDPSKPGDAIWLGRSSPVEH
jgi:hypothetical protein